MTQTDRQTETDARKELSRIYTRVNDISTLLILLVISVSGLEIPLLTTAASCRLKYDIT